VSKIIKIKGKIYLHTHELEDRLTLKNYLDDAFMTNASLPYDMQFNMYQEIPIKLEFELTPDMPQTPDEWYERLKMKLDFTTMDDLVDEFKIKIIDGKG
jgi:hypothetical protein